VCAKYSCSSTLVFILLLHKVGINYENHRKTKKNKFLKKIKDPGYVKCKKSCRVMDSVILPASIREMELMFPSGIALLSFIQCPSKPLFMLKVIIVVRTQGRRACRAGSGS
jgi:hypothetical protein